MHKFRLLTFTIFACVLFLTSGCKPEAVERSESNAVYSKWTYAVDLFSERIPYRPLTSSEYAEIINGFREIVNADPENKHEVSDDAQLLVGETLAIEGRISEAEREFRKVRELYPSATVDNLLITKHITRLNEVSTSTLTGAYAHMAIAILYNDINSFPAGYNLTTAVKRFREFLKLYPEDDALGVIAQYQLANALSGLNEHETAIAEFNNLVAMYPDNEWYVVRSHQRIGEVLSCGESRNMEKLDKFAEKLANIYSSPTNYYYESSSWDVEGQNVTKWSYNIQNKEVAVSFKSASSKHTNLAMSALNEWGDVLSPNLNFKIVESTKLRIHGGETDILITISEGTGQAYASPGAGNLGGLNHCDMYLYEETNDANFRKQALHEIGHCLGLMHSFNREDIMTIVGVTSNDYLGDGHLTDRDRETIRMVYS